MATETLLKPEDCAMLLVDFQAGLGFGVESASRQALLNNAVALARTAAAFNVPVVVSTSASRAYSGPLLPALQDALPSVKAIDRRGTAHRSLRVISSAFGTMDSTCSWLRMRVAGSRWRVTSWHFAGWSTPALA